MTLDTLKFGYFLITFGAVYNVWARCLWHVKYLLLVKVHVYKSCARRLWSLDIPVLKA